LLKVVIANNGLSKLATEVAVFKVIALLLYLSTII